MRMPSSPTGSPATRHVEHAGPQPAGFEPSVDDAREGQTHDDGRQNEHPGRLGRRTGPPRASERGARRSGHSRRKRVGVDGNTGAGRDNERSTASIIRTTSSPRPLDERGWSTCPDRVAEVAQLDRKRLRGIDARRDDVARAVGEPELAEGLRVPQVDARVEDAHRLGAACRRRRPSSREPTIVVRRSLLGASQESSTWAIVPDAYSRSMKATSGIDATMHARAVRADVGRRLAQPVAQDREVVRARGPRRR